MKRNMIIAVDFDGTLCKDEYPNIGRPNIALIEELKEASLNGSELILWTCRTEEPLRQALNWCESYGLFFDYVNENTRSMIKLYGGNSRKIFADVYIDDRAQKVNSF